MGGSSSYEVCNTGRHLLYHHIVKPLGIIEHAVIVPGDKYIATPSFSDGVGRL